MSTVGSEIPATVSP